MKKCSGGRFKGKVDHTIFQETIVPYAEKNEILFGSIDVGDVSWGVPTAQYQYEIVSSCLRILFRIIEINLDD